MPQLINSTSTEIKDAVIQPYHPAVKTLDEVVREHITNVLTIYEGSKEQTAKALGIDRKTLYRKLKKMEIKAVVAPPVEETKVS